MQDAEARWLFIADGFPRRGKVVPMRETAFEALRNLPQVQRVFVIDRAGREARFDPRWKCATPTCWTMATTTRLRLTARRPV
jgi:acyl-coenzyme A synthetase/AMP-(fatty) acid ligase